MTTPERSVEEIVEETFNHYEDDAEMLTVFQAKEILDFKLTQERQRCEERVEEEREQNILDTLTYDEAIKWWLDHYEGMEHMHVNPEAMYTITSILKRCFQALIHPNNTK